MRERVGGAGGRSRGVRGRRPLLLGGGVGVTGVQPIGGSIVGAAMIRISTSHGGRRYKDVKVDSFIDFKVKAWWSVRLGGGVD